jgi:ELWxxDGT repeat protein
MLRTGSVSRTIAILLGFSASAGAQPLLVKDIRTTADLTAGASPSVPLTIGTTAYFGASDEAHGFELWRTDGTAAGTTLVKDIRPGSPSSSAGNWSPLVNVNGTFFFAAHDGSTAIELWKSDGTAAGTQLVKDIYPGMANSLPGVFGGSVAFQGMLFFANTYAVDDGAELWKSDGTAAGTTRVKDINELPLGASFPADLTVVGTTLFFTAFDPTGGDELWKTDGTSAGTVRVADIVAGTGSSSPFNLRAVGNTLLFVANDGANGTELWTSDGTASGTILLKDIAAGAASSSPSSLTVVGNTLYFAADDGVSGNELWKTDGTAAGTVLVKDIAPGSGSSLPGSLAVLGNTLFFSATDSAGRELWSTDGTTAGTLLVKDIGPGGTGSSPDRLTAAGGSLYFVASTAAEGSELWKSDGTAAGTVPVRDIWPGPAGSTPQGLSTFGTSVLFSADDGVNGRELWISDGTSGGTLPLTDTRTRSSLPREPVTIGGTTYFTADDGVSGRELWKTDGSSAGTMMVIDIQSGAAGSFPTGLTAMGNTLFFSASGASGNELWRSDGSAAGTFMVADIQPGLLGSAPSNLVVAGSTLYFSALTAATGSELWTTDGTAAGTVLVKDAVPGTGASSFLGLGAVGSRIYYWYSTAATGYEPWTSDGTDAGTFMLKDVNPGVSSSFYTERMVGLGSKAVFVGLTADEGPELWVTDGTTAGTFLLKDITPGPFGEVFNLVKAGNFVFFTAWDAFGTGHELWKTDGTPAGTVRVADIFPGIDSSDPLFMVAVGNNVFFSANDGVNGTEVWTSDGTAAGTHMVADIGPGAASSAPIDLGAARGRAYFAADNGVAGSELWTSDGTPTGTYRVADIAPGAESSSPKLIHDGGAGVFFVANDGTTGDELWLLPPSLSIGDVSQAEGNTGTSVLTFTATLSSASTLPITASYATQNGSASSGSDYVAASGTVTFPPGWTSQTISVTVNGDTSTEDNESFAVVLTSPTNATLGKAFGQGTIVNDDNASAGAAPQPVWSSFFAVDLRETPMVGDFNGDGKTDIITFARDNPAAFGDVYVSLSTGSAFGPASKWHDFFAINGGETVVVGDYNGDGKDDIATWLGTTSRQVYVARSQGTGMEQSATVWLNSIGTSPSDVVLAGDVNGDGKQDLIAFARTEGKVYVSWSTDTSFSAPTVWHNFFAVSTFERPAVGDLNADGRADIVTFATDSPTAFGDVYTALSNGAQFGDKQNSRKWHDFFAIRPTERVRIGDLNNDGKDDFFTFLPSPFAQAYTVLSEGNAMAASVLWPEAVAPLATDLPFVGDVNGDGKADIIVFAQVPGKVYVSLGH